VNKILFYFYLVTLSYLKKKKKKKRIQRISDPLRSWEFSHDLGWLSRCSFHDCSSPYSCIYLAHPNQPRERISLLWYDLFPSLVSVLSVFPSVPFDSQLLSSHALPSIAFGFSQESALIVCSANLFGEEIHCSSSSSFSHFTESLSLALFLVPFVGSGLASRLGAARKRWAHRARCGCCTRSSQPLGPALGSDPGRWALDAGLGLAGQ
jgi:hypothetical protein